jgi:uncharacterized protein
MKRISVLLTLLAFFTIAYGQSQVVNPFPKTIQVNGSSEMEIIPDRIYVVVHLKEYEKKGTGKIDLEKIKNDFLLQCKNAGIPDSLISIASYEGYNGDIWWRKKRKKDELYASIAYQVIFTNSKKMDELVDRLDDDATQNFQIVRTSHSKLEEFRRQLKIEAVKAAKAKADYLAAAINETPGEAITIDEPHEFYQPYQAQYSNKMQEMNMRASDAANQVMPEVDFKKIKLRFEVRVVFALK